MTSFPQQNVLLIQSQHTRIAVVKMSIVTSIGIVATTITVVAVTRDIVDTKILVC